MLGASCGGPCHDGDMVGGEALAGTSASTATARIRARERRGNGGELTEVRRACSAARGELWSRRSGDGDPRRPEAKKATATAPRDAPACVLGGELQSEEAELLRVSERRGGDGGCGNGEWRRRQRSGAVRESKGESEGKNEEVDRTGTAPATSPSASRWQGRGQAGWWRGGTAVRARRPHACPTGARTTTTGTGPVGRLATQCQVDRPK